MQYISITKFNEEKIREMNLIEDSLNFVNVLVSFSELEENERCNFPFLSTIEPYDNTILNYSQCKVLIEEIKKLLGKKKIVDVENILKRIESIDNLEYLIFRGD